MNFAWKFMLPMALVVVVSAGAWRFHAPGCDAVAGQHRFSLRSLMYCWPVAWRAETKSPNEPIVLLNEMTDEAPFLILAGVTFAGACAAMMLRGLVHCALALAVTFAGIGALYLNLGAQFLGLAQLLVYVGAIAVLIVFVILLTRGERQPTRLRTSGSVAAHRDSGGWLPCSACWPGQFCIASLVHVPGRRLHPQPPSGVGSAF